eukprot:15183815-Alexandrium_andersonii.AAC.1
MATRALSAAQYSASPMPWGTQHRVCRSAWQSPTRTSTCACQMPHATHHEQEWAGCDVLACGSKRRASNTWP